MISLFNVNYFYRVLQPRIEIPQLPTIIIHLLWGVMGAWWPPRSSKPLRVVMLPWLVRFLPSPPKNYSPRKFLSNICQGLLKLKSSLIQTILRDTFNIFYSRSRIDYQVPAFNNRTTNINKSLFSCT